MRSWLNGKSLLIVGAVFALIALFMILGRPSSMTFADQHGSAAKEEAPGSASKEEAHGSEHKHEEAHGSEHKHEGEMAGNLHDAMEDLLTTVQGLTEAVMEEGMHGEVREHAEHAVKLADSLKPLGEQGGAPAGFYVYADLLSKYAEDLHKEAAEGSIDNVILYLNQMNVTCVACHSDVR